MAIFTGFVTAVSMYLFFDPVNPAGPSALLWPSTRIVGKYKNNGIDRVDILGWQQSAAEPNTIPAFFTFAGDISTSRIGKSLTTMTGTVMSINEVRLDGTPSWQVYVEDGVEAKQLLMSPSFGKAMQVLFNGDDEIRGSTTKDTLYGFKGNDKLIGRNGDDTYFVDSLGDRVVEAEGEGTDLMYAYINYDGGSTSTESVETFVCYKATSFIAGKCTSLAGNGNNNIIFGNEFKNKLRSYGGKDILYGGSSHPLTPNADKEVSTLDDDKLDGGSGNDLFFGFGGNDILIGGKGADLFIFNTPPNKASVSKINDFSVAKDRIGLAWNRAYAGLTYKKIIGFSASIFSDYYPGFPANILRFTKLLAEEFATINDPAQLLELQTDDRVIYDKNSGLLYYDKDGSGVSTAKPIVRLAKKLALTADAILLVDEADAFPLVYDPKTRR
jgi:Ca2+-binding RTX toxin-like protein